MAATPARPAAALPTAPAAAAPPPPPPPTTEPPTAPPAEPGLAEIAPQLWRLLGSVVAPTTLLTALLYYFGRLHQTGFFRYFRVNFSALDLSTTDYLVRSADGVFLPIAAVALAVLVALRAHRWLRARPTTAVRTAPAVAAGGAVLLGVAVARLLGLPGLALLDRFPEADGLALAVGVLLLAYAAHLRGADRGPLRLPEWAAVFLLVSVGLFGAVGDYAIGVGTGRAMAAEAALPVAPDVVLYSERPLGLAGDGVREVRCRPGGAYAVRYEGLKLVVRIGGQYVFLPSGWSRRTGGAAILLPRTDAIRLEFRRPGDGGSC